MTEFSVVLRSAAPELVTDIARTISRSPSNLVFPALDGTAGAGALFRDFVEAAMTSGRALFLPPGEYNLSDWTALTTTGALRIKSLTGVRSDVVIKGPSSRAINFVSAKHIVDFEGVTFQDWNAVVLNYPQNQTANIDYISFVNVSFVDCIYEIFRQHNDSVSGEFLNNFTKRGCLTNCSGISAGTRTFSTWISAQVSNVSIKDSRYKDLNGSACWIGNESKTDQLNTRGVIISDNFFEDLVGPDADDTNAISVRAYDANITGNRVKNVASGDAAEGNEGIYGKLVRGIISGNIVENCGAEGGIVVKGYAESDVVAEDANPLVNNPAADGFIIALNTVKGDSTRNASAGITLHSVRGLVIGNTIVGARNWAVRAFGGAVGYKLSIKSNSAWNTEGPTAFLVDDVISDVEFVDNTIDGMTAAQTPTGDIAGFKISVPAGGAMTNISFRGNKVRIGAECVTTGRVSGLQVVFGGNSASLSNVPISNNEWDVRLPGSASAKVAMYISGSGTSTLLDGLRTVGNTYVQTALGSGDPSMTSVIAVSSSGLLGSGRNYVRDAPMLQTYATASGLKDKSHPVNLFCKEAHRIIACSTDGKLYHPTGTSQTAVWRPIYLADSDTSEDITPV